MSDFTDRRRLSFGAVADQYDRVRPRYPIALVEDVLAYASGPLATGSDGGSGDSPRILEVGAGTGIATLMFGPHAGHLLAIEPDAAMAAVASRRAATAGLSVEILNCDFESAELPAGAFDLIISATAWHWVRPELGYPLAARLLAPGGALAAFWNRPVWRDDELRRGFAAAYASVSDAFVQRGPYYTDGSDPVVDDVGWADIPEFVEQTVRTYSWAHSYSSAEYIELLGTHSDHQLLPAAARRRLFERLAAVIDARGGSFELPYETLLLLARRGPGLTGA